jgi:pimeloyl-ACP methyl ester carboxylesterase
LPKRPDASLSPLYKATAERLENYQVFSEATIKTVASLADKQASYRNYRDFFSDMGIPEPHMFLSEKSRGVPVVDIQPKKNPAKGTLVLHLPMVNPLDQNQLYHVATIVAALPGYRVIAFGNPSGKPYAFKEQNLSVWNLLRVAFTNNQMPLVASELKYLQSHGIESAHYVGYSYGAHKALIEASYAEKGTVKAITLIDPVAHPRRVRQLIHDFRNTFNPLGRYVDRTAIESYFQARRDTAKTKHHDDAFKRLINIAIGFVLKRLDFITLLEKVQQKHPGIATIIAWGSEGELGNDAHMKVSMHRLKYEAHENILALRLKGDKHAFANDIHLYAAIVLEAVSSHAKMK